MRVLLVEDEPVNRLIVEDIFALDEIPAELVCVESAEEAIQTANRLPPDLILMDVQLPKMSGIEATRKLRQNLATSEVPVWAISARAMPCDEELALQAGCNEYICKPFDIVKFSDMLRDFLSQIETR
jgi:CheY-like chemotaxis protein